MRKIKKQMKTWRKLLNLKHWDIEVEFVQPKNMAGEESLGEVNLDVYRKNATIYIIDPKHEWWKEQDESDIEFTLLHEMLHVKLGEVSALYDYENDAAKVIEEQYINDMTRVILNLTKKRKKE